MRKIHHHFVDSVLEVLGIYVLVTNVKINEFNDKVCDVLCSFWSKISTLLHFNIIYFMFETIQSIITCMPKSIHLAYYLHGLSSENLPSQFAKDHILAYVSLMLPMPMHSNAPN